MGTVVHSEAQEGNKYILTLIMKAIVAYALAAFAAIASTPTPIEATPNLPQRYDPYDAYPAYPDKPTRAKREYGPYGTYEDYYDYGAAAPDTGYSDAKLHDDRLTKREEYADERRVQPQQGVDF